MCSNKPKEANNIEFSEQVNESGMYTVSKDGKVIGVLSDARGYWMFFCHSVALFESSQLIDITIKLNILNRANP